MEWRCMQRPCEWLPGKSVNTVDPIYIVRHDNEHIQTDKREMNRYLIPNLRCNLCIPDIAKP